MFWRTPLKLIIASARYGTNMFHLRPISSNKEVSQLFHWLQGASGGHPSRRPTPSSSTGSSDLQQAKSWKDAATATATPPDAAPHPPHQPEQNPKFDDTSTSRDLQQQIDWQTGHCPEAGAAGGGGGPHSKRPPPGFVAQLQSGCQPAAAQPTQTAWDGPQPNSEAVQPTSAAHTRAADPTAVASSPQLQASSLPAKPMLAVRAQRYRPDEAERFCAEQREGDQEAKRSRTGQSPHHMDTLTNNPPKSAAEGETFQVSFHSINVSKPNFRNTETPLG